VVVEKANGQISYVNDLAIELYGMDPRGLEMPNHSTKIMKLLTLDGEIYTPEKLPASIALLKGEEAKAELIIERPNGLRVIVSSSAKPIVDETGEVVAAVGILEDITERKKAEKELRKSEARLRLIAEAGRIGFFEYNASKDVAYWSPEHYKLLGYEPGAVISWERWLEGVHPDDKALVIANAARLKERGLLEGHIQGH